MPTLQDAVRKVAPVIIDALGKALGVEPTADAVAEAVIADPVAAQPWVASTGDSLGKTLAEIEAGIASTYALTVSGCTLTGEGTQRGIGIVRNTATLSAGNNTQTGLNSLT
jgi:hypothetical protein